MTSFVWLAEAIRRWPLLPETAAGSWSANSHRRLWDALSIAKNAPHRVGARDIASLARHVLRREAVREEVQATFELPAVAPWPTRDDWKLAGCIATELPHQRCIVSARAWRPDWLCDAENFSPADAAFGEQERRTRSPVSGDGFLSITGFEDYSAPGQRQAMRAVLASRPGATVLVNLPTGTGKSSVAHVPALLWGTPAGVSLVVVPTTALALDQERAVRAYPGLAHELVGPLAYHSELSKNDRDAVRKTIRDGTQRLLFTSPESVTGSLAPALFQAAQSGFLRLLVLDEAHLVSQWGAEFRPEFQALSGIRRALLRTATESGAEAFRTVLLTATLTEEALAALHTLFGEPGPFEHVSAVTLRPEPSYWIARCNSEEERVQRLLEAIANLPRPLIVYVATTQQSAEYSALLRQSGFKRVAEVSGTISAAERMRVIRDLRGDSPDNTGVLRTGIDIVVATSAFGLGVDQADVRAVVHACIPETIDRFYQEVGRGGRDGLASVSVLLWCDADKGVARNLNQRRIIRAEKGFARWSAMFRKRAVVDAARNLFGLPLDARPPYVFGDSDENRAWNIRTLSLMSRAGLLELDAEPPPRRLPDETDEQWEARFEEAFARYRGSTVVRLLTHDANESKGWEQRCHESRDRTLRFDDEQLDAMFGVLTGAPSICEVLQHSYSLSFQRADTGLEINVVPERSCGGCPACRLRNRKAWEGARPIPPPLRNPQHYLAAPLNGILRGAGTQWVFVPPNLEHANWRREVTRLIERIVRHGVRNVVAPQELLAEVSVRNSYRYARGRYVFLNRFEDEFAMPEVATLWVHPYESRTRLPLHVLHRGSAHRPWILVVPDGALDPEHPTARASQFRTPQMSLSKLIASL